MKNNSLKNTSAQIYSTSVSTYISYTVLTVATVKQLTTAIFKTVIPALPHATSLPFSTHLLAIQSSLNLSRDSKTSLYSIKPLKGL